MYYKYAKGQKVVIDGREWTVVGRRGGETQPEYLLHNKSKTSAKTLGESNIDLLLGATT